MRLDAVQDVGESADAQVDWNPVRFSNLEHINLPLSSHFVSLLGFRADKSYVGWIEKLIKAILSFLGWSGLRAISRIAIHCCHRSFLRSIN